MKNKLLWSLFSVALLCLGWLGITGVGLLVALVPLLQISDSQDDSHRGFWRTFGWVALVFGLWSAITTWWIWIAAPIGAILSVIITVSLMGGVFMLYHYVSKRAPRPLAWLTLVCGWIAAEYLYTTGQVSFPWLTLGNGLANDIRLVQWYSITGVFGGTLWLLLANISLFELLQRRWKGAVFGLVVTVPVAASLIQYYTYREQGEKVKVSIVQPNIDPYNEKFSTDQWAQTNNLMELSMLAPPDVDFIVMPETAIDDRLWEEDIDSTPALQPLRELALLGFENAQLILGATTFRRYDTPDASPTARTRNTIDYWYDVYNSVLAIDARPGTQIRHKTKLVIGVETMPYRGLIKLLESFIIDLGGTTGQLGFDPEPTAFTSPEGLKTGAAVCYEGIYGEYMAGFVKKGAEVLFIISNDGWWGDTPGYRQLFAFARLRAVELRRDIARSANTGKSGFITSRGDVVASMGWDKRGTMTEELTVSTKITPYALYGDLTGRVACYAFLLAVLYFIVYRVRKKDHLQ